MTTTKTRDRYHALRRLARIDGPCALPDEHDDTPDPLCDAVRASLLTHGQHERSRQRYLDTTPSGLPKWYRCWRHPHLAGPQTAHAVYRQRRAMDRLRTIPLDAPHPRVVFA